MKLEEMATEFHSLAVQKGFYDQPVTDDFVGMKLALIHSEVTEILEALRKDKDVEELAKEFADVVIRLLDLWAALRDTKHAGVLPDLDSMLWEKHEANSGRPQRHGVRF